MPLQITGVHLEGGRTHQHITQLRWRRTPTGQTGQSPRAEIVRWLEHRTTNLAYVNAGPDDADGGSTVSVVHPPEGPPYLRTVDDRTWGDDLLHLPRF